METLTCDGVIVSKWYFDALGSARLLSVHDFS